MTDDFDSAWRVADRIPGWLTRRQAYDLWQAAGAVAAGSVIVEIGSHQGRSTVVLADRAASKAARVVAIDPFVEGRLFGGASTRTRFEQNVDAAGAGDTVRLVAGRSTQLRPSWTEPLSMVYIDGKHDLWTVGDDLRWAEHLTPGSPLLLHDTFSSIGVTLAVLLRVLPGRTLRYDGRTGSLARFTLAPPSVRDRVRILAQLPWFLRNVAIKIAFRVLRAFGHHRPDPF